MGLLELFGHRKSAAPAMPAAPAPATHVVVAKGPGSVFNKKAAAGRLRHGMWVKVDHKVGILTALAADGKAEVMLTNDDGSNALVVTAQAAAVHQAAFEDIPLPRRPVLEHAMQYGYARRKVS